MKPFLCLAAFLFICLGASGAPKPAELILGSKQLDPTTTFEIRFAEPMIAPESVGKPADPAPLVFRPAVQGRFTWLSVRSGVFAPSEALPLSTTFQLGLTPGVPKADGLPLDADFHETVQTPPMQLKGWNATTSLYRDDATAEPKISLLFNVNIDPAVATRFCKFIDKSGAEVPARVVAADQKARPEEFFPIWRSSDRTLWTWAERFSAPAGDAGTDSPRGNLLFVTPVQPLPAGEDWKLIVGAGLPACDGGLTLLECVEIPIGRVRAFELQNVEAANAINHGRRIVLSFSKRLAKEVTAKNLARWIRVEPAPEDLAASVTERGVEFTGAFALATKYRVRVEAALPAAEPFVLPGAISREVEFSQVPSRLYFEEFSTHQLSTGRRQFHLLAINVPRVKVSAKLFPSDTLALALGAFQKYHDSRAGDGSFMKVNPQTIPGQIVWQRELPGTLETDEQQPLTLDWNEILGAKQNGAVLLTVEQVGEPTGSSGKRPGAQALVQITDLGVVWKQSAEERFAYVFSLATAKPIADAKLQLVDAKGAVLAEVQSDESGFARLPEKEDATWLLAQTADDRHLVNLTNGEGAVRASRFVDLEEGEDDGDRPIFLFSDRPVYQPGETLHLKAIARDLREGHVRIPAGREVRLTARDSRGRAFFTKTLKLSETGALSENLALPKSVLGTFQVAFAYTDAPANEAPAARHSFEVQEYRPNAFEISIGGPKSRTGAGEITLPVTAKYYMGKALSKATLAWSIDASDEGFAPAGFEEFAFCNTIENYRVQEALGREGHFNQDGKLELNEHGAATITTTIPINPKAPQPRSARVLCEITDLNQQTVSNAATVTAHASDFYLGVRRPKSVVRAGESLPIELVAVQPDGTRTQASATVRLTRIDWQTNRVQGAGYADTYHNEPRFTLVAKSDANTQASTTVIVPKPGDYLLEAATQDSAGRDVLTAIHLHVYGPNEATWNYRNPYEIELVPDRAEYLAGQTATLLVKTPIQGEALVTIEREKVLRSFIAQLRGNAPSVQIPLDELDAPNVFVSVLLLRGADQSGRKIKKPEFRLGYCELKVARPDSQLQVEVRAETKSYQPGELVNIAAEVLDFTGRPVGDAEVTLYAVDEGVLSLMGYETPDPLAFFHAPRALAVTTGLTLPTLLSEDPDDRGFGNKGYLVGGGGEEGERLRKNFVACAFWNGALRTDESGLARASFQAPDGLTRYRVIAVVQTIRDQFGSAESAFEVHKPLMLEPALPRFANVGDQLLLRAVVHNATEFAGEAEVTLALDGTAQAASKARRVSLPARGSMAIDFPVEFVAIGKAIWKWTATFVSAESPTAFRDAVQTELNVGFPAPLLRAVHSGHADGAQTTLLERIDPQLLGGTGIVRVSVSNSRLLELRESLRELLHYPYGCVEQTTSSTLPWLTLRDLREALPELQKTDAEIAAAVQVGVERLLKMQTDSGGLAYWPGEREPLFWGSAYGGLGLALAQRQGYGVPAEELARLMKYLSAKLRGAGSDQFDLHYRGGGPSDRCLAVYALAVAGHAEPAYHELLFKKRDTLSAENRGLLALAIGESGGEQTMIEELLKPRPAEAASEALFGNAARVLAVRLMASKFQPASPAADALVTELLGARQRGHWQTTQGNAWSLVALADTMRRMESGYRTTTGTLTWGGQTAQLELGDKPQMASATFNLNGKDALAPLVFTQSGKGRVFTEVMIEARPPLVAQPAQDCGYSIRREYRKIEDDDTTSELKDARVGDRVLVQLAIDVREAAAYVAVDDPLPAIFEAINPAFKSQEAAGDALARDWEGDYRELRADRALFFANSLAPGHYTIRYLARVCAAGKATAPAAKIEEMYHPERSGLTASTQVTSLPLQ